MQRRIFIAGVQWAIILQQQVDVVEEEAVEAQVVDERFHEADVLKSGSIEEFVPELLDDEDRKGSTLSTEYWEDVVEEEAKLGLSEGVEEEEGEEEIEG